jgi:hypothetical protein
MSRVGFKTEFYKVMLLCKQFFSSHGDSSCGPCNRHIEILVALVPPVLIRRSFKDSLFALAREGREDSLHMNHGNEYTPLTTIRSRGPDLFTL